MFFDKCIELGTGFGGEGKLAGIRAGINPGEMSLRQTLGDVGVGGVAVVVCDELGENRCGGAALTAGEIVVKLVEVCVGDFFGEVV